MNEVAGVIHRVRIQVKDVVEYYGHNKDEKARMRRVANSIIQRCRHAYEKYDYAKRCAERNEP